MNKYYELDKEEAAELQAIEDALENYKFKSRAGFAKRKKELEQIAKNSLNKTKNINIRLSERDLYKLKAKAIKEGLPYQTLASSILHKEAAK